MDIATLLTEKDIAQLKERAKDELLKQIIAQFNPGQIAAEIRNQAMKNAVTEISEKVFREKHIQETITRAVSSVESRLNLRLHKMLESGVKVQFPMQDIS